MQKIKPVSAFVPAGEQGKRLDAALAVFYPELGLRARRRLWEWCRVLLDGRAAGPGAYVRAGQRIEVLPGAARPIGVAAAAATSAILPGVMMPGAIMPGAIMPDDSVWSEIRLVAAGADYCAVFKPGGLPSARVGGGSRYSVEEYLSEHWCELGPKTAAGPPLLCNRLDTLTSGLLLLAFGRESLKRFRELEAAGAVEKRYYALVRGAVPEALYLDRALDMNGRAKTLVLPAPDPDPARHTAVRRLAVTEHEGGRTSLLEVIIKRGARHQIRAHLAAAGFPIVGDPLYGQPGDQSGDRQGGQEATQAGVQTGGPMYLHHHRVAFPGFSAEAPAPWPGLCL